MKRVLYIVFALSIFIVLNAQANLEKPFYQTIQNCEKFSKYGIVEKNGEKYHINISLNKNKDVCKYKETITIRGESHTLNCEFNQGQLDFISNSMKEYSNVFKNEILKNKIYEAKLTNNGVVFQEILVNPAYCKINTPKK